MQSKRKRISHKVHKNLDVPEENWVIIPNHHQALISKKDFDKVQELLYARNIRVKKNNEYTYYACSSYVRKRGCNNKNTLRKDILEKKVIKEINDRQAIKIDKLNRKYIFDLINMIYLNKDGSIKIEFKRK